MNSAVNPGLSQLLLCFARRRHLAANVPVGGMRSIRDAMAPGALPESEPEARLSDAAARGANPQYIHA